MLKYILIIFTIFCFSSAYSQHEWTPAKVILKNGTSFRGLVKFPKHSGGLISIGSTAFKYKKNRKSKTEKYGNEAVQEVIFGDEAFATVHYKYVPIRPNKHILLKEVVCGKVSLYSRTVLLFQDTYLPDLNPKITGYYYDDTQFYLKRKQEQVAKLIVDPNTFISFPLETKKYFSDCKEIVDYLDNDLYELNNLIELVEDYNLLCE